MTNKTDIKNAVESKKPTVYFKPSKLVGGETWSGIFTGTHEQPSLYDDSKTMATHYIEGATEVYGLNGTAQLDALMRKREKGQAITVEYTGRENIIRKNGKAAEAHSYNVIDK